MNRKHPLRARLTCVFLALALLSAIAAPRSLAGDATLQAGNSPVSLNLTSDDLPLDSGFIFEIGAFDPGLTPTPFNTLDWIDHWHPMTDGQGNPLPEATVAYDDSELGGSYPEGARANLFSITVTLTHNFFPFAAGSPVYLWGFDRREGGGTVEWILITNPDWHWPAVVAGTEPTFRTFDVSHPDSYAIIGQVNEGGVEMRTGSVTLSSPVGEYEGWLASHFTPAELADPAQEATRWGFATDADRDGIPNAIEFLGGTLPTSMRSRPSASMARSGNVLKLTFVRLKNPGSLSGAAQWSTDLMEWSGVGVTEAVVEDLGDRERIEASVTVPNGGRAFMRLIASAQGGAG